MRAWVPLLLAASAMTAHAADGFPDADYMCVVDGIDGFANDFPPPSPTDARMACRGTIHYTLRTPQAELVADVSAVLDSAETTGYPVFLTFDDWNFPPDAWKDDPAKTEWIDWNATLCPYRIIEWSTTNPENPPPNFESTAVRSELEPKLDAVFSAIAARLALWKSTGRAYLFAGVALGWESGYYTEFDPPPFRTGYAALTSKGISDEDIAAWATAHGRTYDEEFDARMYEVVHDYVAWICARAVAAGIPRSRVFTHFTGVPDDYVPPDPAQRDGRLVPWSLAGNGDARPGHTATPEWIDLERLATEAASRNTPDWAAPEWEAISVKDSRGHMLQYLSRMQAFGASVSNNWGGWWGALDNPYEIHGTPGEAGMQDWLSGGTLLGVGVPVGRSTLAGPLDYSDTWTEGVSGRVADGSFPVTGAALGVESSYGNPPRAWTTGKWSFRKDANLWWTLASPDPRGNWAGSRTGMTETGGSVDFGIEYGLRQDYVVQLDAVQTDGRVAVTSSGARDTTGRADGISVFFHPAGAAVEVGIYNVGVGERDTGFHPGLTPWFFDNYAVRFDLPARTLTIYANERRLGAVDLDTFAGGAFAAVPVSNAAITVGATVTVGDRVWTDNVQVGAPCPAPPDVATVRLARDGDDVVLDWRTDPATAYGWRVYALSGPTLSERTLLAAPDAKTWRDPSGATTPGIRYYRVEAANDCE